jgi:hypothetical protein
MIKHNVTYVESMKLNLLSQTLKLNIKFKYTLNHKIKNNPIQET